MTRKEAIEILEWNYFTNEELDKMSTQKICAIAKKVLKQEQERKEAGFTW